MYNQGDILLIPIPFTDLSSSKRRPVLVISNFAYNEKTEDIIVVAVTSNLEEKEYNIILKSDDMSEGYLKMDSCIRADKIYTLSKTIVIKKFGTVKKEIINKIREKIEKVLDE
ncbi:MAG: type II toxin-antitoxin system PemK/MazF family toxin [Clostridiaceae bacterium]|nr:type II toxin-antitoxin system PemK/MazF family toxin [Clostridiaceae bacterium]